MRESLWINRDAQGEWELTAAVSNLGGVDGGKVEVEFLIDGKSVGRRSAAKTPASFCRNFNRVFLKLPLKVQTGFHRFEARIVRQGRPSSMLPSLWNGSSSERLARGLARTPAPDRFHSSPAYR